MKSDAFHVHGRLGKMETYVVNASAPPEILRGAKRGAVVSR